MEDYFFFYGHNFRTNGTKAYFSNWYPCTFVEDDIQFDNSEQYMMYRKAILFGDQETSQKILETSSPKKAKMLGRKVKNFDPKIWGENCMQIVTRGCFLKFSQNTEIKETLLSTNEKTLVEASPYDKIWGIGLTASQAQQIPPTDWPGKNLLGICLMEVRNQLKKA